MYFTQVAMINHLLMPIHCVREILLLKIGTENFCVLTISFCVLNILHEALNAF